MPAVSAGELQTVHVSQYGGGTMSFCLLTAQNSLILAVELLAVELLAMELLALELLAVLLLAVEILLHRDCVWPIFSLESF